MSSKLVRDKVPDLIRANGQTPITHIADDEEYAHRLREKLAEEVDEFLEAAPDQQPEELADVWEVLMSLSSSMGLTQVTKIMFEKAERLGRFDGRVVWDGNAPEAPSEMGA